MAQEADTLTVVRAFKILNNTDTTTSDLFFKRLEVMEKRAKYNTVCDCLNWRATIELSENQNVYAKSVNAGRFTD